jgi:8-oxo-dGTP pyrophosphatase MutT (NUDIX family)
MTKTKQLLQQSGVLPYRYENGIFEIMLVTTTSKKEWIIPKGKIEKDLTSAQSALKEAEEEAGITGVISGDVIGSYSFIKKKNDLLCRVDVFPMKVTSKLPQWQERGKRKRRWCSIEEAVELVSNQELRELIRNIKKLVRVL